MKKRIKESIFWAIFALISITWVVDYSSVLFNKKPYFCISKEENIYKDGKVTKCNGIGYVVRNYERETLTKGMTFDTYLDKEIKYEK